MGYSLGLTAFIFCICTILQTGTKISSLGPPLGIDPTTHRTMSGWSTTELHLDPATVWKEINITKEETLCRFMGYSSRLVERDLRDRIVHTLCYPWIHHLCYCILPQAHFMLKNVIIKRQMDSVIRFGLKSLR